MFFQWKKIKVQRCIKTALSLGLKKCREIKREGGRKISLYKHKVTYLWKGS